MSDGPVVNTQAIKKREKELTLDFALHVALIQKQDGCPKSKAQFIAWCEGRSGLSTRLNPEGKPLKA